MPIDLDRFTQLLTETNYDPEESAFLIDGFSSGFDIGYEGSQVRKFHSRNIPFTVGDKFELWSKIMKEVRAGRYTRPYEEIPYEYFIQSPVGLVPKVGNKTRLIFHLSYEFPGQEVSTSLNGCTPRDKCSVRYNDLDSAVKQCLCVSRYVEQMTGQKHIFLSKTDLSMVFRVLPLKVKCFCWMVLMAEDPLDGKWKYFIDICLPFGASISCSHYQRFSNALRHILRMRQHSKTNYLDDFLFIAFLRELCNQMIQQFMDLCLELCVPIVVKKTQWASSLIVFLGILLDGKNLILSLPIEKQEKALKLLNEFADRKKATIQQIQVLTRFLNFLTKAIFAGRTFTRRMYVKAGQYQKGNNRKLKQHHHVRLDAEFKFDCEIWRVFLTHYCERAVCWPMIDLDKDVVTVTELEFYSDASANEILGFGAVFNNDWLFGQWEPNFINDMSPSIEYLELFALVAALLTWGDRIQHTRVIIFCDNSAVVQMVNALTSSCKNCMYLIRLLTLNNLVNDRRVFVRHLRSEENYLLDTLSRMKFKKFWQLAPATMNPRPTKVSPLVWPVSKIWQ